MPHTKEYEHVGTFQISTFKVQNLCCSLGSPFLALCSTRSSFLRALTQWCNHLASLSALHNLGASLHNACILHALLTHHHVDDAILRCQFKHSQAFGLWLQWLSAWTWENISLGFSGFARHPYGFFLKESIWNVFVFLPHGSCMNNTPSVPEMPPPTPCLFI